MKNKPIPFTFEWTREAVEDYATKVFNTFYDFIQLNDPRWLVVGHPNKGECTCSIVLKCIRYSLFIGRNPGGPQARFIVDEIIDRDEFQTLFTKITTRNSGELDFNRIENAIMEIIANEYSNRIKESKSKIDDSLSHP